MVRARKATGFGPPRTAPIRASGVAACQPGLYLLAPTLQTVTILFWFALTATLLALVGTVFTGFTHRRGLHLGLAPLSLALLAVTIVLAERMGAARDFPPEEMAFHLKFAYAATFLTLPVIVTGVVLWRTARWRRVHLVAVVLFLLTAVTAVGTGVWVFGLSTPR